MKRVGRMKAASAHRKGSSRTVKADVVLAVALVVAGLVCLALSGCKDRNRIMGTGERTRVSAMTDVDRFHDAIRRNDHAAAMQLVDQGRGTSDRMGTPTVVLVARYTDDTALLDAVLHGQPEGQVSADTLKRTALSWAASENHVAIVNALLGRGASLESRDITGKTPLFHAVLANATDAARLLVTKGANVDARDAIADTPLMLAAAKGNGALVDLLLSAGADRGAVGSGGRSAAMRATASNVRERIENDRK